MQGGNGNYWVAARAINDQKMLGLVGEAMKELAYEAGYNLRDVLITVHHHQIGGVFLVLGTAIVPKDRTDLFGDIDVDVEMGRLCASVA